MRHILLATLLLISFAAKSQTYGWNIRVDPTQDPDTSNVGVMYPEGNANLTGRMHFVSYLNFVNRIAPYFPDTVYVNAGDSLVIVSIHGDTTYFQSATDTHWGNANLTQTGNRTHDAAGYDTQIDNQGAYTLYADVPTMPIWLEKNNGGGTPLSYLKLTDDDAQIRSDDGVNYSSITIGDDITFLNSAGSYVFENFLSPIPTDNTLGTALSINAGGYLRQTNLSTLFGSYANTSLSNLSGVGINASLTPNVSGAISLGSNTKLWSSAYLSNSGLKMRSGTKDFILSVAEPLTVDRTLSINMNDLDHTIDLESGIQVIGMGADVILNAGSDVSGTNTGDQDLSGYVQATDTSTMLSHYIERGDTATMLSHYIDRSSTETIGGVKTFSSDPLIPDEAYGAGWNGSLEPPTKNAVYDKIETIGGTSSPTTISPSQITGDQDNYNPTGIGKAAYVRIDGDSGFRAITGIADSTAGTLEKTLLNVGSYPLYMPMEHPDSDAAHRFIGLAYDYILYPGNAIKIFYDVTSSRWRIVGEMNTETKRGVFYSYDAASITPGDYGELGFSAISGGGIDAWGPTTSLPARSIMTTNASATAGHYLFYCKSQNGFSAFGSAHIYADAYFSLPTLSDGTNTYTIELQIGETVATSNLEENNMFGIRYSNGINSGKFELFSQSNTGTETTTDLGTTVATNTLYKLRIEVDKSKTEARAYVNGTYAGRVTGTLPNSTTVGARLVLLKSAGLTARTLVVHQFNAGAIYP